MTALPVPLSRTPPRPLSLLLILFLDSFLPLGSLISVSSTLYPGFFVSLALDFPSHFLDLWTFCLYCLVVIVGWGCACTMLPVSFLSVCLRPIIWYHTADPNTGSRHLAHQIRTAILATIPQTLPICTPTQPLHQRPCSRRQVREPPSCHLDLLRHFGHLPAHHLSVVSPHHLQREYFSEESLLTSEETSGQAPPSEWKVFLRPLLLRLSSCSDPHCPPPDFFKYHLTF